VVKLIYKNLLPKVEAWITSNNGDQADAMDIFQETLETILLKVDKVNSSFDGLVIQISKHKWLDRLRKQAVRQKAKAVIKKNEELEINSEDELREQQYLKYKLMERYFNQLSETCQSLMQMLKQGRTVEEVIKALGFASANTLYRRKAACIERWSILVKEDQEYKLLFG